MDELEWFQTLLKWMVLGGPPLFLEPMYFKNQSNFSMADFPRGKSSGKLDRILTVESSPTKNAPSIGPVVPLF